MDPKGRDEMLALIWDLAHRKGVNLILSSHLLPDVESTCDQVIVLHEGRVAAGGPIAELKGPSRRAVRDSGKGRHRSVRRRLRDAGVECHSTDEDIMRVLISDDRGVQDLFALAVAHDVQVRHLRPSVQTLEDVFAKAIGEE